MDQAQLLFKQREPLSRKPLPFPTSRVQCTQRILGHLRHRARHARGALGGLVVNHDELAVTREMNIRLDAVSALRKCEAMRRERVLRSFVRRSTVRDDLYAPGRGTDGERRHCGESEGQ